MLSFLETVFKNMTHASPLATQGKAPTEALSAMVWHDFDKAIVIN